MEGSRAAYCSCGSECCRNSAYCRGAGRGQQVAVGYVGMSQ